jgi:hypothetical protein
MVYGVCHIVRLYPVSGRCRQITLKVPNMKLRDNPPGGSPGGVGKHGDGNSRSSHAKSLIALIASLAYLCLYEVK